jgi:hypothetical protein
MRADIDDLQYPKLGIYSCDCGCGRHVLAGPSGPSHVGYWGPQNAEGAKASGCSGLIANRLQTLAHDGNAMRYRSRASALRALRRMNCEE